MLKTALTAVCGFTVLATGYLGLSVLLLRPPRANIQSLTLEGVLFVAQGVLTLAMLNGLARGALLRVVALAGACVIGMVGGWAIHSTLNGPHFEGYALVLGAALIIQAALTLAVFLRVPKIETQ